MTAGSARGPARRRMIPAAVACHCRSERPTLAAGLASRADLGEQARPHRRPSIDIAWAASDLSIVAKDARAASRGNTGPRQTTLIVRNDKPMRAPEDLKGKTIGISTAGGLSHWVVRQLSRKLGFGPDGIKYAALGADSAQVAALRTGAIDGTVMDFASGLRLEELGTGRIFLKVRDYVPVMITQATYAHKDVLAKRPDAVRNFLRGWYDAVAFMRASKAATIPIAARQMDVSPAIAGRIYDELIENYSTDGRFEIRRT